MIDKTLPLHVPSQIGSGYPPQLHPPVKIWPLPAPQKKLAGDSNLRPQNGSTQTKNVDSLGFMIFTKYENSVTKLNTHLAKLHLILPYIQPVAYVTMSFCTLEATGFMLPHFYNIYTAS